MDVLSFDFKQASNTAGQRLIVVGNLPYYITSPILEKTLALGAQLNRAVFLVQKEVAERLTARPGTRDYGYLTVQTQLLSAPELLFTVPAGAFHRSIGGKCDWVVEGESREHHYQVFAP